MALIRDMNGAIVPLGRTIRTFDDPLIPGTAFAYEPGTTTAWLTCDLGTASFNSGVGASTNPGQVTAATGAGTNDFARIRTNFQIAGANYKEIIWTVEGLVCDTDAEIALFFGISANGNEGGCDLVHSSAAALASIQTTASGAVNGTYPTNYRLVDGSTYQTVGTAEHYKNLTMRLQPVLGKVYILEDDQDMAAVDISSTFTNSASLNPYVMIQTQQAVSHNFKVSRFTLTLVH